MQLIRLFGKHPDKNKFNNYLLFFFLFIIEFNWTLNYLFIKRKKLSFLKKGKIIITIFQFVSVLQTFQGYFPYFF